MAGETFHAATCQLGIGAAAMDGAETIREMSGAKVKHILTAHKALKGARDIVAKQETLLEGSESEQLTVVTFDARFAKMPPGGSQASFPEMSVMVQLECSSSRVDCVVMPTLASEAAALSVAQDRNECARVVATYFSGRLDLWKDNEIGAGATRNSWATGSGWAIALRLLDEAGRYAVGEARGLELYEIRQGLERNRDELLWILTRWMLANAMTKAQRDDERLNYVIDGGECP